MRKNKLIDMSGLSGDPLSNDQLEALFFRLESEIPNAPRENSKRVYLPFSTTLEHPTGISTKHAAGKTRMLTRRITRRVARPTTPGRVVQ